MMVINIQGRPEPVPWSGGYVAPPVLPDPPAGFTGSDADAALTDSDGLEFSGSDT
jgi:hypothetical protein